MQTKITFSIPMAEEAENIGADTRGLIDLVVLKWRYTCLIASTLSVNYKERNQAKEDEKGENNKKKSIGVDCP